ncbi:MAG: hypothetical protein RL141_748 [Candidatus Parcubacteria bacterium]|jgi:rod shape-determining protein MreC
MSIKPRTVLLIAGGLAGLLLLMLAGVIRPVRERVRFVLLPVARVTASMGAGIGRALHIDPGAEAAQETVRELEARLRSISVDYVRLRALEEENRSLRAQAQFIADTGFRTLGARVISRAIRYETAAIVIDRGARDGIEVGHPVVTDDGILLGKVFSLGERTATVVLVSDERSRVAASVSGTNRLSGVVEGQGNGTARFTLVPQSEPLAQDDVVVTAGTEDRVPANLVIGWVNNVESRPTDPFKSAALELLAAMDRADLVSVILPAGNR